MSIARYKLKCRILVSNVDLKSRVLRLQTYRMITVNKTRGEKLFYLSYCSFHIMFVKGFLAITFYYLFFQTETFMMSVNVFYMTRNKISVGSDKK